MTHGGWIAVAVFLADLLIRLGLSVRVIMRRLPVGVALAWLVLILVFPFVGAFFYLFLGEYRLGRRRTRRALGVHKTAATAQSAADSASPLDAPSRSLAQLGTSLFGAPLLPGNRLQLLPDADAAFPSLIADIDRASQSCHLEYYIWNPGGRADDVGAALLRAASRGVACRVLVDALGSAAFLKSDLALQLRRAGVRVQSALGTGAVKALFARPDLRLHRKIVVIDELVGYAGSLNMADPKYFKQDAGVGQWVDALARVEGPGVGALNNIILRDWAVETGEPLEALAVLEGAGAAPAGGTAHVQVLSSGPFSDVHAIEQIHLMAVYLAERELTMTTPYFVPSESFLMALLSAAARGVKVTLITPAKIDSRCVHFASRAHQAELLAAGVKLALYQGGLLHTKSLTVDGQISLFGSVNLDPRSLHLDFEVTLAVYDAEFTTRLCGLQDRYLGLSQMLDLAECQSRSPVERFKENAARLAGPVL